MGLFVLDLPCPFKSIQHWEVLLGIGFFFLIILVIEIGAALRVGDLKNS